MAPLLFLLFIVFIAVPAVVPVRSKQTTLKRSAGGSISIPCFYGQQYKNSVKSWCKRKDASSCSPEVHSDAPRGNNRVTITDDPHNLVFIVTMRNLQKSDEGSYWCAVDELGVHKATSDEKYSLITTAKERSSTLKTFSYLRGQTGGSITIPCFYDAQSVRTETWVSAQRGGSVTIPCYYDQNSKDKTKYLCRGYEWDSCSRIAQSDGEQSRGTVSVSDDRDQMLFNVTMRDLQEEDFDYYWCAVEASAAQSHRAFMPLIVREVIYVPTTQQTEPVTSPLTHPRVTLTPNITGQSFIKSDLSITTLLLSVGIVGVLLFTVVMVSMILRKRSEMVRVRNRNRENTVTLSPSVDPGDEVTYISVTAKARNAAPSPTQVMPLGIMSSADPNVIYSYTSTQRKKAAADPHEVVYSAVARR
ncbi:CMRF35-like molecule 1 isoform X7 [Brienomyrus brachyistius]|uniref:CMRF35-like molecule 1 isoform X7 n=1 Tax=Brienomyrus brachyistius TaxID=42636 RepID=UPI0020B38377|nr:CMRF35-like molecule 1 isoform X7 [Brienomyrus brachyistius]